MRYELFILLFLFSGTPINCQTTYKGNMGSKPIEFALFTFSDGQSRATVFFNESGSPKSMEGHLAQGDIFLTYESPWSNNIPTDKLHLVDYKSSTGILQGHWYDFVSSEVHEVKLTKEYKIDFGEGIEWKPREFIQPACTDKHYFKVLVKKDKDRFFSMVSGVNIYERKTDRLLQTIELDCDFRYLQNIWVDDYNFDGYLDFQVFEASYTGPNTTSIYILWNEVAQQYEVSDFTGVSLEFDQQNKTIYERNVSGGGSYISVATYKVIDNKMVLEKQTCLKFSDETEKYEEEPCN